MPSQLAWPKQKTFNCEIQLNWLKLINDRRQQEQWLERMWYTILFKVIYSGMSLWAGLHQKEKHTFVILLRRPHTWQNLQRLQHQFSLLSFKGRSSGKRQKLWKGSQQIWQNIIYNKTQKNACVKMLVMYVICNRPKPAKIQLQAKVLLCGMLYL